MFRAAWPTPEVRLFVPGLATCRISHPAASPSGQAAANGRPGARRPEAATAPQAASAMTNDATRVNVLTADNPGMNINAGIAVCATTVHSSHPQGGIGPWSLVIGPWSL